MIDHKNNEPRDKFLLGLDLRKKVDIKKFEESFADVYKVPMQISNMKVFLKIIKHFDFTEFFVLLKGNLKSSKMIQYIPDDNNIYIMNYIDSSEESLTLKEFKETFLYYALRNGALYLCEVSKYGNDVLREA